MVDRWDVLILNPIIAQQSILLGDLDIAETNLQMYAWQLKSSQRVIWLYSWIVGNLSVVELYYLLGDLNLAEEWLDSK